MIIIPKHLYQKDESNEDINSESFKFNTKTKQLIPNDGNTKNVETSCAYKLLSNYWGIPEMSLINCEINLMLTGTAVSMVLNYIKKSFI